MEFACESDMDFWHYWENVVLILGDSWKIHLELDIPGFDFG